MAIPIPSLTGKSHASASSSVYLASPFQVGSGSLDSRASQGASGGGFPALPDDIWPAVALAGAVLLAVTLIK
ncbi:MAG: hypothetical protein P8P30_01995 [Rickettsiales bacterium]|nr:hypothetical protein [Rickettsiales bacterium]